MIWYVLCKMTTNWGLRIEVANILQTCFPANTQLFILNSGFRFLPATRWGYFSLNHADNAPGYEPPNEIHLFAPVRPNFICMACLNAAKSAKACSLLRYCRLSSLMSLKYNGNDCGITSMRLYGDYFSNLNNYCIFTKDFVHLKIS